MKECEGMRILIYSANFAPEPTGIGKYSGEMAAWLAEQGHDVRVVAAPPYYPDWKVAPGYTWPPYRRENYKGVTVWRAPLWVPRSPGGLTRILHLLSFALSSFPLMLRQVVWRADIVITVAPAFLCAPAGWITAKLSNAQAWLHLQDFEIDIAFQLGLLKNKLLKSIVLGFESFVMKRFDSVSTISHRMVERLLSKGVPRERTRLFPNWVDISHISPAPAGGMRVVNRYRKELNISSSAIVVLFSGTLGGKQGLMMIPEVARTLAHRKDVVFVICGDGVMKPDLEAATVDLPNVHLLPLQPFAQLGELLRAADIHLLPQSPRAEDLVLPSKLSGMIASGRPVIATCRPGTELASVVSKCGLIVPPEDCAALAHAIEKLTDNAETRMELGRRGRAWAEANVDRDAVLGEIFGSLESDIPMEAKDAIA
jgi:colanic acid biosynthesis glycosyl transferase WcaI